jgi:hypothetical protein
MGEMVGSSEAMPTKKTPTQGRGDRTIMVVADQISRRLLYVFHIGSPTESMCRQNVFFKDQRADLITVPSCEVHNCVLIDLEALPLLPL